MHNEAFYIFQNVDVKSYMGQIITWCLLFFSSAYNKSAKQLLQGLLDYFLPSSASKCIMADVDWLLKEVSTNPSCFSEVFSSESARRSFLKEYLLRIFSIGSKDESNHLIICSDQVNLKFIFYNSNNYFAL